MFEVVRMLDSEGSKRFRTLQVKGLTDLVKLVNIEESRTSRDNTYRLPPSDRLVGKAKL